jgi:hypothetical protein
MDLRPDRRSVTAGRRSKSVTTAKASGDCESPSWATRDWPELAEFFTGLAIDFTTETP